MVTLFTAATPMVWLLYFIAQGTIIFVGYRDLLNSVTTRGLILGLLYSIGMGIGTYGRAVIAVSLLYRFPPEGQLYRPKNGPRTSFVDRLAKLFFFLGSPKWYILFSDVIVDDTGRWIKNPVDQILNTRITRVTLFILAISLSVLMVLFPLYRR